MQITYFVIWRQKSVGTINMQSEGRRVPYPVQYIVFRKNARVTGIELRTRVSGLQFNTYRGVASEIYQTSKLLNLGRVCSNLLAKLKISCDY